ncbi:MAG TPA: carboxypeptidase regulatory-like domain-containing protein [Planctomycetes bacterium]|nr:carboxypeptidase regulatory-like domain-containing protein [Planctomycetota bacterium]
MFFKKIAIICLLIPILYLSVHFIFFQQGKKPEKIEGGLRTLDSGSLPREDGAIKENVPKRYRSFKERLKERERRSSFVRIKVLDSRHHKPQSEVSCYFLRERDLGKSCFSVKRAPSILSDRMGGVKIDFSRFRKERVVGILLYKKGFIPKKVGILEERDLTVFLERTSVQTILCVNPKGEPLSGITVVASKKTRYNPPPVKQSDKIVGIPGSKRRVWGALTDKNGRCNLEGMPPGPYRFHVYSDHWQSLDRRFNGQVGIQISSDTLKVVLHPILAALFKLPKNLYSQKSFPGISWRRMLLKGPRTRIALMGPMARAKEKLKQEFTNSLVNVALPASSLAYPEVKAEVLLQDGSFFMGIAKMLPISKGLVPHGLTLTKKIPQRKIKIVKKQGGPPISLGLFGKVFRFQRIQTGKIYELPCGDYRLGGPTSYPVGVWKWKPRSITINPGDSIETFRLDLGQPMKEVELVFSYKDPNFREPLYVQLICKGKGSMGFMPKAIIKGKISTLLPYGKILIKAKTLHYGVVEKEVIVGEKTNSNIVLEI